MKRVLLVLASGACLLQLGTCISTASAVGNFVEGVQVSIGLLQTILGQIQV
jgi:hypothetical protein